MFKLTEPGTPAHSWEWLERKLIGAVLSKPELFTQLQGMLPAEPFAVRLHNAVWKAMQLAAKADKRVEIGTIIQPLTSFVAQYTPCDLEGKIIDPATYLNILHYAWEGEVEEFGQKHDPFVLANEIREGVSRGRIGDKVKRLEKMIADGAPLSMIDAATRTIMEGEASGVNRADVDTAEAGVRTMSFLTQPEFKGMDWGLRGLQDLCSTLKPREYSVVMALSGGAKTVLALTLAYNIAKTGKQVRFHSLEMGVEEMMYRLLARESGVPYGAIYKRDLNAERINELEVAARRLAQLPITFDERSFLSVPDIFAAAARQKSDKGLDLLIVDHLSNVQTPEGLNMGDRAEQKGYGFKAIAKDLNCHVFAVSQVNGEALKKDAQPGMNNMREGPGGAQAPSTIIELRSKKKEKDDDSPNHVIEAHVVKNRHGPQEMCKLVFNTDRMMIYDPKDGAPGRDRFS